MSYSLRCSQQYRSPNHSRFRIAVSVIIRSSLRSTLNLALINNHAALGGGDQLVEGVLLAHQARIRRGVIVHHIEPVTLAQAVRGG